MVIRFINAKILTMAMNDEIIDGEIVVKDKRIEYVGRQRSETVECDKIINCNGNLLMPGLKNAHTHSPMTFLRSYAEDLPLDEWLHKKIFPNEARLTKKQIYWNNKLAILEYLEGGITANLDMYLEPEVTFESSEEAGYKTIQVGSLNDFTLSLQRMEECYKKYNNSELTGYMFGVHAEYTCQRELLEQVAELANRYKAPVYLHAHETEKEVLECKRKYGYTPTVFLERMGMYKYGGGGFHCVHMTDEDIDIYRDNNMHIITCPASNAKLASGIAPIKRFLTEKINVAIGTDGPASNNALDMFREMYLVAVLSKLRENNAVTISPFEVIRMATSGGAYAMGLKDCDDLSPGKYADIIMIDLDRPNMHPSTSIVSNLVYSTGKQNVIMTMINGRILYMNGEFFIDKSKEEIYERCEENIYV